MIQLHSITTWFATKGRCENRNGPVVGDAPEVVLTLDWTDPKTKDGQFQTLSLNLRAHGRALPLLCKTVRKTDLKGRMREYEEALWTKATELLPARCHVTLLADRGFATVQFFWRFRRLRLGLGDSRQDSVGEIEHEFLVRRPEMVETRDQSAHGWCIIRLTARQLIRRCGAKRTGAQLLDGTLAPMVSRRHLNAHDARPLETG